MESSFNLLDLIDVAHATLIGMFFMLIANICHIIKNKFSALTSVIFAALSCATFILISSGVLPDLTNTWFAMPIVALSSYLIFLYYVEEIKYGVLGSFILALAVAVIFYTNLLPVLSVVIIIVATFLVAALSLIIGVASSVFEKNAKTRIVRFFGFVFYVILFYAIVCMFV